MNYLFTKWQELKERLKDKYTLLFLDYDGTLTPIVETPEQAIIPKETKELLEKLTKSPKTKLAIISGRALKDIKNKVGLKNIIYVGNHGLEIEGPKIKFDPSILLRSILKRSRRIESPIPPRCRAILERIKDELNKRLFSIKGVILENKGFSLSLHYRLVNRKLIPQVKTILHETTILYVARNKIKIKPGKMVFEVRPPLEWDKGKVALWLLARQKFALKEESLVPIYIGDDKTDEDAFRALKDKGLTIFVGRPGLSCAQYYLKNPKEVYEFLRRILEIQKENILCQN